MNLMSPMPPAFAKRWRWRGQTGLLLIAGCLTAGSATRSFAATEVATGSMLGPRFKAHQFYIRRSPAGRWKQTYSNRRFRGEARGKLVMIRFPPAVFSDEWLTEREFDPDKNTDAVIASLELLAAHGVGAIGVNLQGPDHGYGREINGIAGQGWASPGQGAGGLVSAFKPDGSLKPKWLHRLERLIEAADGHGLVVCLSYFSRDQDEVFESAAAIVAGARNITDWLIEKNFRNVVIDVAYGWDVEKENWDHGAFIPESIAELIETVRERFQEVEFTLPIGASAGGGMTYPSSLARICDVILVHGNGLSASQKRSRLPNLISYQRPVWMIEDDNGYEATAENLRRERVSADTFFKRGAGWGYRPSLQARFPYAYQPGESGDLSQRTTGEHSAGEYGEKAYYRAVLEHIASLVLKKPPTGSRKKNRRK